MPVPTVYSLRTDPDPDPNDPVPLPHASWSSTVEQPVLYSTVLYCTVCTYFRRYYCTPYGPCKSPTCLSMCTDLPFFGSGLLHFRAAFLARLYFYGAMVPVIMPKGAGVVMPVDLDGYGWDAMGGRAARGEGKGRGVRHRAGMEVWSYGAMEPETFPNVLICTECSGAPSTAGVSPSSC